MAYYLASTKSLPEHLDLLSIKLIHDASFNTLRPRQDDRQFADDIFNSIFFNEKVCILIKISQKFVPKGPINNKSLSEPMVA